MFPTYKAATKPQTTSGLSKNSIGPAWISNIKKAPNITAVVADPGTPKANIGTKAPALAALFADSGPATPFISPFPKFSGFLLICLSVE